MDTPIISLWVQLKSPLIDPLFHLSISFFFIYLKTFLYMHHQIFLTWQVMNGLIIGHNVKDHTNGRAPLRSLPVIFISFLVFHLNQHDPPHVRWLILWLLSRFQHWSRMVYCRPWRLEGTSRIPQVTHILSHSLSLVSHPLPTGICECILDTRRLWQLKPPSGAKVVCSEEE